MVPNGHPVSRGTGWTWTRAGPTPPGTPVLAKAEATHRHTCDQGAPDRFVRHSRPGVQRCPCLLFWKHPPTFVHLVTALSPPLSGAASIPACVAHTLTLLLPIPIPPLPPAHVRLSNPQYSLSLSPHVPVLVTVLWAPPPGLVSPPGLLSSAEPPVAQCLLSGPALGLGWCCVTE